MGMLRHGEIICRHIAFCEPSDASKNVRPGKSTLRKISRKRLSTNAKPPRALCVSYSGGTYPMSKGHSSLCHHYGDVTIHRHRFGGSKANYSGDTVSLRREEIRAVTKGKFPNGVSRALDAAQISQAELARRTDESRQQIGRIINGERKLALPMALKIAAALNCDVRELFIPPDLASDNRNDKTTSQQISSNLEARKARILDEVAGLSFDSQAEILSEALASVARRSRLATSSDD